MPVYPQGYRISDPSITNVRACPLCEEPFISPPIHRHSSREVFKRGELAVCELCLWAAISNGIEFGPVRAIDNSVDVAEAISFVHKLTSVIPRAGTSWRREALTDEFYGRAGQDHYVALVRALHRVPSPAVVNELFGSWHAALVAAGVFADGTERRSRGVVSLAEDGHLSLSVGERVIDDWLHSRSIPHTREPLYPGSRCRGDFLVGDTYIEFFGLAGDAMYDQRAARKRELALENGIDVIGIYPTDVANWAQFSATLLERLSLSALPRDVPDLELREAAPPMAPTPRQQLPIVASPGWYKDPFVARRTRWHDGTAWTHHARIQGGRVVSHSPGTTVEAAQFARFNPRSTDAITSAITANGGLNGDAVALHCAFVDERENDGRKAFEKQNKEWAKWEMREELRPERSAVYDIAGAAIGHLTALGFHREAMAVADRWVRFSDVQTRWGAHRNLTLLYRAGYEPDPIAVGYAAIEPVPTTDPIDQVPPSF